MKPIQKLERFRLIKGISVLTFEKNIGMSLNSFRTALTRKSSLKDETLANIRTSYPELNLDWLLLDNDEEEMIVNTQSLTKSQQSIEEPDLLFVYDLVDKLGSNDSSHEIKEELKREIVKLFTVHTRLKKELHKLKRLSDEL